MMLSLVPLPDLVVAPTGDETQGVNVRAICDDAEWLGILCPTLVQAATSIIQVSDVDVDASYRAYVDENGDAIVGPDSAQGIRIRNIPFPFFRVKLNTGETLGTTMKFYKLTSSS